MRHRTCQADNPDTPGQQNEDVCCLTIELARRKQQLLQDDAGVATFRHNLKRVSVTGEVGLIFRRKGIPLRRLVNQRHEPLNAGIRQVDHVRIGDFLVVLTGNFLPQIIVSRQLGQFAQDEAADAGMRPFQVSVVDLEFEAAIRAGNEHLLGTATAQVIAFVKADVFEVTIGQYRDGDMLVDGMAANGLDQLTPQNLGIIEDVLFEVEVLIGDENTEARIISLRFHGFRPYAVTGRRHHVCAFTRTIAMSGGIR